MSFFVIYVREAHAADGRASRENERAGIRIEQPKTTGEREAAARNCLSDLKLSMPFLIDNLRDTVGAQYDAFPDRLFVIDKEGRIAFRGAPGPRGFDIEAAATALEKLLAPPPERTEEAAEEKAAPSQE